MMSKQRKQKSSCGKVVIGFFIGALLGCVFSVIYLFFGCFTSGCGAEGVSARFFLAFYYAPIMTVIGAVTGLFISLFTSR